MRFLKMAEFIKSIDAFSQLAEFSQFNAIGFKTENKKPMMIFPWVFSDYGYCLVVLHIYLVFANA